MEETRFSGCGFGPGRTAGVPRGLRWNRGFRARPRGRELGPRGGDCTADGGFVAGCVEEGVHFGGVGGLQLEQPGGVGVCVDGFGGVDGFLVGADDLAGDRGVDVGGSLDRFDHRDGLAGGDSTAGIRQLEEDHVAEGLLGVVGDADGQAAVGLDADPFVGGGVTQVAGDVHGSVLVIGGWR
jgi:hypothetical protein